MTVLEFEHRTVDLADYPPIPVVWAINSVDLVCQPLQCSGWRDFLQVPEDSWLSHRVPSITDNRPQLMTYSEFLQHRPEPTSALSPSALYEFAFETPSTVVGDLGYTTGFVLALMMCFLCRRLNANLIPYVSSLGRESARITRGDEWVKQNQEMITRFGETFYMLLCHAGLALYGIYYFHSEAWWAQDGFLNFVGQKDLFLGFPHQAVAPTMAWYYIIQWGYNLDLLMQLVEISFSAHLQWPVYSSNQPAYSSNQQRHFGGPYTLQSPLRVSWSNTVRKDFGEMAYHDVLTVSLIFFSSFCRMTRVGSMVVLLHDVSAVLVKVSKLCHFLKMELGTLIAFTAMLLTWFVTRIYILPISVLAGAIGQQHYVLAEGLSPMFYICYRTAFQVGLGGLCLLQLYWFILYGRVYRKMLTKYMSSKSKL